MLVGPADVTQRWRVLQVNCGERGLFVPSGCRRGRLFWMAVIIELLVLIKTPSASHREINSCFVPPGRELLFPLWIWAHGLSLIWVKCFTHRWHTHTHLLMWEVNVLRQRGNIFKEGRLWVFLAAPSDSSALDGDEMEAGRSRRTFTATATQSVKGASVCFSPSDAYVIMFTHRGKQIRKSRLNWTKNNKVVLSVITQLLSGNLKEA